jgi:hypothetical protein
VLSTQEMLQEQVIKRNVDTLEPELTKAKASGIPATNSLLLEAQALFEPDKPFRRHKQCCARGAEVKAAFADINYCQAPQRSFLTVGLWRVALA